MFPKTKKKHPTAILLSRGADATNEVSGAQECSTFRPFANVFAAIASAALLINSTAPAQAQFPWSRPEPKRSDQSKGKGQARRRRGAPNAESLGAATSCETAKERA